MENVWTMAQVGQLDFAAASNLLAIKAKKQSLSLIEQSDDEMNATILFNKHPAGSWRNLRHGEKDFFPEEDWEFYEVQVSLSMGAPVE